MKSFITLVCGIQKISGFETMGEVWLLAITLDDVAKLARVSCSAVSRTFTDGTSVSLKMRIKVEKAANDPA